MSKSEAEERNWEEFKKVISENLDSLKGVLKPQNQPRRQDDYWNCPLKNIAHNPWYCGVQFNKAKNGICLSFNPDGRNLDFQARIKEFLNGKIKDSDYTLEEILSHDEKQRNQGILGSFLLKPKQSPDNHYQWCVDKAIEFSAYLYEFKAQLEGSTSSSQTGQGNNSAPNENSDNSPETNKKKEESIPIKYPFKIKLNFSPEDIKYPSELSDIKTFGDTQCRYTINGEEVLCFVFKEVKKNEQCIFGINKKSLRRYEGENFFQVNDNQGNGVFLKDAKDPIPALPLTYGMTSSWAVGPKTKSGIPVKAKNREYSQILHDWIAEGEFTDGVVDNDNNPVKKAQCACALIKDFNPSMILLGQNWSNKILPVCNNDMGNLHKAYWQNFQPGNAANGKGGLLRDSLEGTLFEKAYMTDLEKGNICTDSGQAQNNARQYSQLNQDILYNEFQDLRSLLNHKDAHLVIGVWGKTMWKEVSDEMKSGTGKWQNCEFRLIGSHFETNPVDRKRCIDDFVSSMTWAKVLYERIVCDGITNKTLLRHICYVTGITIQNELYRKSKDEGDFGAVGTKDCMGDDAIKFLYSETVEQAGGFPDGITDFLTGIQQKKMHSIAHLFNAQCHERGKKIYDILIKNISEYPSVLQFVEELSNSIKTMLS